MGYMSSREIKGRLLSAEHAKLSDAEISLDQVRSEGQRQWNMDMDVEYQYETFNGLPVYYGGDMYDSEDTEEFDPDVQEGMDLMTYTHSRPDGETRGVDTVDMVYMCRTVSWDKPRAQDKPDRTSETDASNIEELNIAGFCQCPELEEEEDPSVHSNGLHENSGLDVPKQNGLNCVNVASMEDFDATVDNSDTDSVAELELIRNTSYYTDHDESPEGFGHM